eukprot:6517224-Prymnesium_polylepis.1
MVVRLVSAVRMAAALTFGAISSVVSPRKLSWRLPYGTPHSVVEPFNWIVCSGQSATSLAACRPRPE